MLVRAIKTVLLVVPLVACLICGTLQAQVPNPSLTTASLDETVALCARFTSEKLDLWKTRLGLAGWQIAIIMTKRADLKPKTLGGIRWDKGKRTAVISVLHPSDYQVPEPAMLLDMEETVVHELLHLKLSSLNKSEAARSSEEEAVNGIAGALLQLDRDK